MTLTAKINGKNRVVVWVINTCGQINGGVKEYVILSIILFVWFMTQDGDMLYEI